MEQEDELITVRNADRMDSETFRKHMTVRHNTSLGGADVPGPFPTDYIEDCWRAFHDTLHRLGLQWDMDHDHGR
jgi:hypothetical protein